MRLAALLVLMAACSSSDEAAKPAKPHKLAYSLPDDWTSSETKTRESTVTVWTPKSNPEKQSITVVRSKAHLRPVDFNPDFVEKMLVDAQRNVHPSRVGAPNRVKTAEGFVGAQLDVDFRPPKANGIYHRTHAVLLDGDELIHVFSTAPDSSTTNVNAFHLVLDSLHHEEV